MMIDFHLGPWIVEPSSNTLRLGDDVRRVGHKVMSVLVVLAEHPGQVVGKEELIEQVWDGTFTSDEVLTSVMYELRKALDDNARRPTYVETIRKRGYRLIAPIQPCPAVPMPAESEEVKAVVVQQRLDLQRLDLQRLAQQRLALWQEPARQWFPGLAAAVGVTLLATSIFLAGDGFDHRAEPTRIAALRLDDARLVEDVDPEVTQAVQLGSHFLSEGTARGNGHAQSYFSRAIELSPTFAPAHVGLADALIASAAEQPGSASAEFRQAKVAAETALAIDQDLPEAHIALASIYFRHEWDWLGAGRHFRRGYVPNSCPVEGSRQYAAYLSAMGRHEEAIAALERSLARDPASKTGRWSLAWSYYLARRYDAAVAELNRVRELDPSFLPMFHLESDVYLASSHEEQAFFAYQRILQLSGDSAEELAMVTAVYAQAGIEGVLRHLVDRALQQSPRIPLDPVRLAGLEARLGAVDAALDWLDRAYAGRDDSLVWIDVDPAFDRIRTSERFRRILAGLGLYPRS